MLEPGRTAPLVVGGTPVRRYACGEYVAVLNRDLRSVGPIEYPHILIVFRATDLSSPVMFITAERNTLGSQVLTFMPEDLRKEMGSDFGKSLFLGVFDESGHANLGIANECADIEVFATRAFTVMKERLKLSAPVHDDVVANMTERKDVSLPEEYVSTFERNLLATLAKIDEVNVDLPLFLNANDLYPSELQQAYARAGYKLALPVNMALMFLMFTHSSNMREFHRPPTWWRRQFSQPAQRRYALIKAHVKIQSWFNAGHTAAWNHEKYPSFLTAMAAELIALLKDQSSDQRDRLSGQLWMTKTPDLVLWQKLAEGALL